MIDEQREGLCLLLDGGKGEFQEEALLQALRQALAVQGVSVPPIWIEHVAALPRNESGKMISIQVVTNKVVEPAHKNLIIGPK